MAKKGNLFFLIKSLSKAEKRYFKVFANAGRSDANYIRLFDFIDSQDAADDTAIRNHFKGEAFIRQLHVAKIYLTDMLMKALRNYYSDDTVDAMLLDMLKDIGILFRKELYDLCETRIDKAVALAARYEKNALHLEALAWKRKLLKARRANNNAGSGDILLQEEIVLRKLDEIRASWHDMEHIFEKANDSSFPRKLKKNKPLSLQAASLRHHMLYIYFFMNGRTDRAAEEITELIDLMERQAHRIEDDPASYVTALSNKISILFNGRHWKDIEELVGAMREVPSRYRLGDNRFTVRLWLRIFNLELELYRDTRQIGKGLQLTNEVEEFFQAHRHAIPQDYHIMISYQVASMYFMDGNFSKSLKWVNSIINENFEETRVDLQCYARFLNLILHFELDNILVLRYAVDSCRRFMKKKRNNSEAAQKLLWLFSRLSLSDPGDYKDIFRKWTEDRELLRFGEEFKDYLDVNEWVNGRIR